MMLLFYSPNRTKKHLQQFSGNYSADHLPPCFIKFPSKTTRHACMNIPQPTHLFNKSNNKHPPSRLTPQTKPMKIENNCYEEFASIKRGIKNGMFHLNGETLDVFQVSSKKGTPTWESFTSNLPSKFDKKPASIQFCGGFPLPSVTPIPIHSPNQE